MPKQGNYLNTQKFYSRIMVDQAVSLLDDAGPGNVAIAKVTDLIPELRDRTTARERAARIMK